MSPCGFVKGQRYRCGGARAARVVEKRFIEPAHTGAQGGIQQGSQRLLEDMGGDWSSADGSFDKLPATDWSQYGTAADTSIGEGDWSSSDAYSGLSGMVIPSAPGGMSVNDGKGGQIAIVHPNEMVLPANLS